MNKLFKYLGIGTAIGTIAYGIIKYKRDQKFKEKVDDVVDKAEEVADKTVGKVFDFMGNHPTLTTMAILTAVMAPAWVITARGAKERQAMYNQAYEEYLSSLDTKDEECDRINETAMEAAKQMISEHYEDDDVDLRNYLVVPKSDYEKYQKAYESTTKSDSDWKEDYRDSFDEVTELSKRITLAPGESYMIEESSQFGLDTDQPVVSHLINGIGCYPPEIKDDQFVD